MSSKMVSFFVVCLTALFMQGCATPSKPDEAPQAGAAPKISAEAEQALAKAEADINLARSKFALWTSAENALKSARKAASTGDSVAVIKHAGQASDQARLGLAQIDYPSTEKE